MDSKRRSNRLHLSSHANVRSTRSRKAWIAALNSRLRPRLGVLRLRKFSLIFGIIPALKIALRFDFESKPPSRLRYAPLRPKPVSLATRFKAFKRVAKLTDRKSTRLNSSHVATSYAVFCLKKKKKKQKTN